MLLVFFLVFREVVTYSSYGIWTRTYIPLSHTAPPYGILSVPRPPFRVVLANSPTYVKVPLTYWDPNISPCFCKKTFKYGSSILPPQIPPGAAYTRWPINNPVVYGQASSWSGAYGKPSAVGVPSASAQASASASASATAGGLTFSAGSSSSANSSSSLATPENNYNKPYYSINTGNVYYPNNYYHNKPSYITTGSNVGSTSSTVPGEHYISYYNPASTAINTVPTGSISSSSLPSGFYTTAYKPTAGGSSLPLGNYNTYYSHKPISATGSAGSTAGTTYYTGTGNYYQPYGYVGTSTNQKPTQTMVSNSGNNTPWWLLSGIFSSSLVSNSPTGSGSLNLTSENNITGTSYVPTSSAVTGAASSSNFTTDSELSSYHTTPTIDSINNLLATSSTAPSSEISTSSSFSTSTTTPTTPTGPGVPWWLSGGLFKPDSEPTMGPILDSTTTPRTSTLEPAVISTILASENHTESSTGLLSSTEVIFKPQTAPQKPWWLSGLFKPGPEPTMGPILDSTTTPKTSTLDPAVISTILALENSTEPSTGLFSSTEILFKPQTAPQKPWWVSGGLFGGVSNPSVVNNLGVPLANNVSESTSTSSLESSTSVMSSLEPNFGSNAVSSSYTSFNNSAGSELDQPSGTMTSSTDPTVTVVQTSTEVSKPWWLSSLGGGNATMGLGASITNLTSGSVSSGTSSQTINSSVGSGSAWSAGNLPPLSFGGEGGSSGSSVPWFGGQGGIPSVSGLNASKPSLPWPLSNT